MRIYTTIPKALTLASLWRRECDIDKLHSDLTAHITGPMISQLIRDLVEAGIMVGWGTVICGANASGGVCGRRPVVIEGVALNGRCKQHSGGATYDRPEGFARNAYVDWTAKHGVRP